MVPASLLRRPSRPTSIAFAFAVALSMPFMVPAEAQQAAQQAVPQTPQPAAFVQCAACHSVVRGENRVGPSLADVYGRQSGALTDFRYSNAMKRAARSWNGTTLDAFLKNPQGTVPGNRMAFSGIADERTRAELIRYLRVLAGSGVQ